MNHIGGEPMRLDVLAIGARRAAVDELLGGTLWQST
jgi:hypothetical protein